MNITFLVGNGFDISAGIDTSYNGFYNWYCSKDANTSKCIKQFKQDILEDLEKPIAQRTWADFELGLGKYTSKFSLDTVGEYLECYENAHKEMITYLEEQESQFKFSELPNKELDKVRSGLLNFYQELSPEEISVFKSLFNADTANSTKLNFISFNYTKILDKYIQAISKEPLKKWKRGYQELTMTVTPNVVHIHGTIDEFPILGVDNESQIENQELLTYPYFSDVMIKPRSVSSIGHFWHSDATKLIKSSSIICVFGMSLGETDSKWWKMIMEVLSSNSRAHIIVFYYTLNPPDRMSVLRYLQSIDKVKMLMMDYSDTESGRFDDIKARIHVVINTEHVLRVTRGETEPVQLTKETVLV